MEDMMRQDWHGEEEEQDQTIYSGPRHFETR